ncbi:hypothetical protein ZWY2020_030763 [Hordeum vulgare]|nr:hypothetical protein ZWY2020_030763 [Hordeum vulgare]
MSELRLRLNMAYDYDYDRKMQEPARRSFAQSVERFSRLASMCSQHRDDVEFGGVSELPDAFTDNCEFSCQRTSLRKGATWNRARRRVAGLLADPAAAALEELRIAGEHAYSGLYIPPLASLPCATATLRVLELHFCCLQPPPTSSARLAFPRLTDLSLRDCTYLEGYLQVVIDAATALTRLALVNVTNKPPKRPDSAEDSYSRPSKPSYLPLCLRCRTVTALVLVTSVSLEEQQDSRDIGIQLDMPSLRSFRYKGSPSSSR